MIPILLDLRFIKIHTFGAFLVLGFFWGSYLLWKLIRLTSYKEEEIFDSLFIAIIGGLTGGRLLYVAFHFNKFGFDMMKFILINGYPGLMMYGVLLGGIAGLWYHLNRKKIKFLDAVNYFIPPLFLGLGFGKLGSFFSGVEAGAKTSFFLAVKIIGFEGKHHITPLYEALLFFAGAYISYRLLFEIRKEKFAKGFCLYFFAWFFALVYFSFDVLKEERIFIFIMKQYSFNTVFSFILLLTFSFYFLYYFRDLIVSAITYGNQSVKKFYHRARSAIKRREGEARKAD